MPRVRLSVIMTHPIQYYAPWFRYIASEHRSIDLRVHYCVTPTPEQQGVGFEEAFLWDSSLLEGYDSVVLRKPSPQVDIHSSAFFGVTVPEIVASVRRARADVVLVPGWYSISLVAAAIAARVSGLPVLYRGDSQLPATTERQNLVQRGRTRAVLRLFTHYLTVGIRNHEYLRSYSIPESKIFFTPHCVDNDFFYRSAREANGESERKELKIEPESFVILFAGKLEEKKRPWEVIEAASQMPGRVTVLIAGSGEAEARCRVAASQSSAQVSFLGFRNQRELAKLYAVADCLALPSASETWGLVVNEALSTGVPCIVSDRVGCGPDLIDNGKTGYIVPFADSSALRDAMLHIRTAIDHGHDFAPACLERAARYSYSAATRGLADAISIAVR